MGGLGWAELLVIGVVALIVIGPKDLPEMFRQLGRFVAKARSMASEFSRAMEQAAKESGAADAAKDLKNITSPKSMGLDKMRAAVDGFEKWNPMASDKPKVKPLTPPPIPAPIPAPITSSMPAPQKAPVAAVVPVTSEVADTPKPAPKPRAPRKPPAPSAAAHAAKPAQKAKT